MNDAERTPLVAGNWKMHKTRGEALDYCEALRGRLEALDGVDLAICPPFTSIDVAAAAIGEVGVGVWGQTCHEAPEGAFTGEVSARMLVDAGATGVLLGHSERRQLFGETDERLGPKVLAALSSGLDPVLCVGETEAERDAGQTQERLRTQVDAVLVRLSASQALQLTLAYEPVWAIGTGRTATPDIAQEAHAFLRGLVEGRFGEAMAATIRILYGGSVKPGNAAELLAQPDIDGALVGGASLDPDDLAAIAQAAASR